MDWKKIPSLLALRAFEAAARRGSFTQAATDLNVTQAAIAQHVRALERELGETLVVKEGRGIAITPNGRTLADGLFEGFQKIEDSVDTLLSHTEARPLSITTTPGFAAHWLMPRIGSFWAQYPEINVSITPSLGNSDLRKDGFDLGIRYGTGTWPGLHSELLTDGQFWVVGAPELLAGRQDACLADTVGLTWFFEEFMLERRGLVEAEGVNLEEATVKLLSTNAMVISAIRAGMGIGIQAKSLVEDDVAKGDLVKICQIHHPKFGYYVVSIPESSKTATRKFTAWLKEQARA